DDLVPPVGEVPDDRAGGVVLVIGRVGDSHLTQATGACYRPSAVDKSRRWAMAKRSVPKPEDTTPEDPRPSPGEVAEPAAADPTADEPAADEPVFANRAER